MRKLNFKNIAKFTSNGRYCVNVQLIDFKYQIERYVEKYKLEMNPDFQRGHVWTMDQQIKFIEYLLKGGKSQPIRFNHTEWMSNEMTKGEMVCVDGLQRSTAIINFIDDKIPVFGGYVFSQIDDFDKSLDLEISVNNLKTRNEVLKWYIELNEGGTPHTEEEINKVKNLLK